MGSFAQHVRAMEPGALVMMDQRVARLFPRAQEALAARKPRALVLLKAGEGAKTLSTLGSWFRTAQRCPRPARWYAWAVGRWGPGNRGGPRPAARCQPGACAHHAAGGGGQQPGRQRCAPCAW